MDPEITRDVRDRTPTLKDQPHTTLSELVGVLARGWHRRRISLLQDKSSWLRSLHRTRDGSALVSPEEQLAAMAAARLAVDLMRVAHSDRAGLESCQERTEVPMFRSSSNFARACES
jgi:hypothetical protein